MAYNMRMLSSSILTLSLHILYMENVIYVNKGTFLFLVSSKYVNTTQLITFTPGKLLLGNKIVSSIVMTW
jgi:hypothetical protein